MASDTPIRILSFVIFLGGVVAFIWWRVRSRVELSVLREMGESAQATVTDVLRDSVGGDHPDQIVISYSFTVEGHRTVSNTETFTVSPGAVPNVGDVVQVRYDPKQPERVRLERKGW
jgi:hypothetical protein